MGAGSLVRVEWNECGGGGAGEGDGGLLSGKEVGKRVFYYYYYFYV